MSDPITGIKQIGPTYPVNPVQPTNKDREPGEKRKQPREQAQKKRKDGDNENTIDEHV